MQQADDPVEHQELTRIQRWYDTEYYAGPQDRSEHNRKTARHFLKHIASAGGTSMLDIGCGTGELLRAARNLVEHRSGVDLSNTAIKFAKHGNAADTLVVAAAENLPFGSAEFDLVTCMGSIEHFVDPRRALLEMVRVSKPGTHLFILVPNAAYLPWRLGAPKGTSQTAAREVMFKPKEWARLFENVGLRLEAIVPDRRPSSLWWARQASGIRKGLKVINGVLLRLLPMTFQYQLLFHLRAE